MDLKKWKIVPDVLPSISGNIEQMKISYEGITILEATELTPSQAHDEPKISWTSNINKFYTLFMTDPDAPGVEDYSFREFIHWVVTDIPGDDIKCGNVVVDYLGPAPPYASGIHRYCFLVYEQKEKGVVDINKAKKMFEGRGGKKVMELVTNSDLGSPISASLMRSQWGEECDGYHEIMGLSPSILPEKYRSPTQKASLESTTGYNDDIQKAPSGDEYLDMGTFHRTVTTTSDGAQKWFTHGLMQTYGYNHEEAIRCYENAIAHDPECSMAYWGLSYAGGPNYNNPFMEDATAQKNHDYANQAAFFASKGNVSAVEKMITEAIQLRYEWPRPETRKHLDENFANAMRSIYTAFPGDPDVAALFAESLMLLRPWKLWVDGKPAPGTSEIRTVLEKSIKSHPNHPGLLHFYVHTMEMSPYAEVALGVCSPLRSIFPNSGHLLHMPSHIDNVLGHWQDAITCNQRGIEADERFVAREGRDNFYTLYRIHNYHFIIYAGMLSGQYELALTNARKLYEEVPNSLLKKMPQWIEAFLPMYMHVLIRFGKWHEILNESIPTDPKSFRYTTAITYYARGLAYAALGIPERSEEQEKLFTYYAEFVPETYYLHNNKCKDLLAIAKQMLRGEIEYRKGHFDQAFKTLRKGIQLNDTLPYDEPWGWMQPVRHALGALLLEQGHANKAEEVYNQDLVRFPNNVWSLHGLTESLKLQKKIKKSIDVLSRYKKAAIKSDVNIQSSCFCRFQSLPVSDTESSSQKQPVNAVKSIILVIVATVLVYRLLTKIKNK